jgi:cytochrome c
LQFSSEGTRDPDGDPITYDWEVGNAAPKVEITSPAEGSFFEFGDAIPFEVTVTDNEDGTVSGDHAACSRMRVQYLLGHDEHSHPITDATGCRGTL